MKLNFNLDDIKYLKLEYNQEGKDVSSKLALKEKRENDFIAVMPAENGFNTHIPQQMSLTFVCNEGLYKTQAVVKEVVKDEDLIYVIIDNPDTLDYQQNREYYRILAEYDCIYTVETSDGIESFNAVTYDISAGGVSIITTENIVPTRETSLVIFMPERDLKTHLQFVRCEALDRNEYKLSFIFTDLTERDFQMLSELCVKKQLSQF